MTSDLVSRMEARLAALQPTHLAIRDDSRHHAGHVHKDGGGGHYQLEIAAEVFRNQPTLARHRLIYAALGDLMGQEIHALAIKARVP